MILLRKSINDLGIRNIRLAIKRMKQHKSSMTVYTSFIYKGAPPPRCNGGLRPPHARQIYEIKLPVKIVQGATRTTRSDFLPSATFAVALSYNFLQ